MPDRTVSEMYARALNVVGLEPDRRQRLLEHLLRTSESSAAPASASAARCAATLLATDPARRLSAPTALAQADLLATLPDAGAALMQLFESLMTLAQLARSGWGGAGLHRSALRQTLGYLAIEMQRLVKQLDD
jgi:hypothetical protein